MNTREEKQMRGKETKKERERDSWNLRGPLIQSDVANTWLKDPCKPQSTHPTPKNMNKISSRLETPTRNLDFKQMNPYTGSYDSKIVTHRCFVELRAKLETDIHYISQHNNSISHQPVERNKLACLEQCCLHSNGSTAENITSTHPNQFTHCAEG